MAELTDCGTNGALNRSKPPKFPDTDDCGKEGTAYCLSWWVPADSAGSEETSAKLPELTDLRDMELLSNDPVLPKDAVL